MFEIVHGCLLITDPSEPGYRLQAIDLVIRETRRWHEWQKGLLIPRYLDKFRTGANYLANVVAWCDDLYGLNVKAKLWETRQALLQFDGMNVAPTEVYLIN